MVSVRMESRGWICAKLRWRRGLKGDSMFKPVWGRTFWFMKGRVFGQGEGRKSSLCMHWVWGKGSMSEWKCSTLITYSWQDLSTVGGAGDGYLKSNIIQVRTEIIEVNRSQGNWRTRQEEDEQQNLEKCLNSSLLMNRTWSKYRIWSVECCSTVFREKDNIVKEWLDSLKVHYCLGD